MTTTTKGTVTKVKKVTVGTPIRRVNSESGSIDRLDGVDTTGKTSGSVLVYNSSSENFEATTLLDQQTVNGGQY